MDQLFMCTQIQYHLEWTKFYFSAVESTECFNLSITEKRCQRFKESEVYIFRLPEGHTSPVVGLSNVR